MSTESAVANVVDYHSRPEISRSELVQFISSRRLYLAEKEGRYKEFGDDKFDDNLTVGTVVHLLLLEPERFEEEVAVWDGKVRSGKIWDRFEARCHREKKIVVTEKQWWLIAVCAAAVRARIGNLIDNPNASREREIFWEKTVETRFGPRTVKLRCRTDMDFVLPNQEGWVFDLKTAVNSEAAKFRSDIRNRLYWVQDAHYTDGLVETSGIPFENTNFIFVPIGKTICKKIANATMDGSHEFGLPQMEKCRLAVRGIEQLACDIVRISEDDRLRARAKWEQAIVQLLECRETGDFSDPGEDDVKIVSNVVS
ncbi:PD-(D/E)XK nuclease-like domain-containing protein [Planctomicrobium sp. SH668]|uniref:PD-(D/E)XK nuclease-like domain-containing protein n=1 Tax=Planctomicrobium sp. SH668 TaxID=3448126 RepID=UPI003F5B9DD8